MEELPKDEQILFCEQIIAHMVSGLCMIRISDSSIIYTNAKFDELFGYEHNELTGLHVSKLNAPDANKTPSQIAKEITENLKQNQEWHGEIKNIRKDGSLFWCHADISTFHHSTLGEIYVSLNSDITDRIHDREKLTKTQLLLKSSIESSKGLTILSIDKNYQYLYFNDTHYATTKALYGIELKIGMNILDSMIGSEDKRVAKQCFDKALSGISFSTVDEYGVGKNRRYFETEYNPVYNENNEIIGATAFSKEITEKKQIEQALIKSEERLKILSDLTSEGIIIHKNGICIDINRACEELTGYKKEELIGKNIIESIVPEEYWPTIYNSLKNESFKKYEIIVKRKNGGIIYVEIGDRRQIDYNGETVIVTSAKDITQYKLSEHKLQKSEADLVSQIENTTESIWSVDKNYKITVLNTNFYRFFNLAFNHQLVLGDTVLDYLPDSLRLIWKERYDRAIQGERYSVIDEFNSDNVPQYVETSFNPVIINDKIEGVSCFTKDITRQKKIEKALKSSEEKFRNISDLSPAAISIHTKHKILYVNKSWEKLTGYSKEEAIGSSPFKIIHPDMHEEIIQRANCRFEGENVKDRYDLKILTKANEIRWIDLSIMIYDFDNQKASLCVSVDITELKKTKENLLQSEKNLKLTNTAKNKLFSLIAHDLRSPFTSLTGLSNILYSEYDNLSDEDKKTYIEAISVTSNKTYFLLENLLNWAKAQQGGISINKVSLDLKSFIYKSIEPYMINAHLKNITVNITVSEDICIIADQYTLMTIIGNIFTNAVKYTAHKGRIDISAEEADTITSILIKDNGTGMSKSVISKLFDLDKSFSTPGTNNEKGTGLGLILCKDFIKLNEGSISVFSDEGKGSTFRINLPNLTL